MTNHNRIEKIDGDSIYFCGHPSRAKNRYDSLATPFVFVIIQVRPILSRVSSSIVIHMLDLSVFVYFCDLFLASFYYVLIIVLSFIVRIMNGVGKGLFIPSHTHTRICMTFKTLYPSSVPLGGNVGYALVR